MNWVRECCKLINKYNGLAFARIGVWSFRHGIIPDSSCCVSEPMSAKDPVGILIPSVFVSEVAGLVLKENYLYNQQYFILINDDLPFNINTHLLLPFAIVVGICFLVMLIFMVSYDQSVYDPSRLMFPSVLELMNSMIRWFTRRFCADC